MSYQLPTWLMPTALRAVHLRARLFSPMTLGVRALLLDGQNRIFLVRHSYVPGWYLPGGGVEVGETTGEALAREIREEANIELDGDPALHGVFFNKGVSRRDHVVVYVAREFRIIGPRRPDWEIVETGFFDIDALPEDATRSTRARVDEVVQGHPLSEYW